MKNTHYDLCNGCGVCTLSCPLWRQRRDMTITAGGRAMAMKGGASLDELRLMTEDCVLCGACGAVCPMGVDTMAMAVRVRAGLDMDELARRVQEAPASPSGGTRLMPGSALRSQSGFLSATVSLLGQCGLTADDAEPLVRMLEGRASLSMEEASRCLISYKGTGGKFIVVEGLLHRLFKECLGPSSVMGIGEALLDIPSVRQGLRPTDLYIIDSRAFHADFTRLIAFYDNIRRAHGLQMNLDLQRSASTTGAAFGAGCVNPVDQARWIMEGRDVGRVVIERIEDMAAFRAVTDLPVLHLSEVAARA